MPMFVFVHMVHGSMFLSLNSFVFIELIKKKVLMLFYFIRTIIVDILASHCTIPLFDASISGQINSQRPATQTMKHLVDLHHDIFSISLLLFVVVFCLLFIALYKFKVYTKSRRSVPLFKKNINFLVAFLYVQLNNFIYNCKRPSIHPVNKKKGIFSPFFFSFLIQLKTFIGDALLFLYTNTKILWTLFSFLCMLLFYFMNIFGLFDV